MSPTTTLLLSARTTIGEQYKADIACRRPDDRAPFGKGTLLTYIHADGARSLLYQYPEHKGEAHLVAHVPAS